MYSARYRRHIAPVLFAVVGLLCPLAAEGQEPERPTLAPADVTCDSAALRAPERVISRPVVLVASPAGRRLRLPRQLADSVLSRVALTLALPAPLHLPVFGGLSRAPDDSMGTGDITYAAPGFHLLVRLTVDREGALRRLQLLGRSMNLDIDTAMTNAVGRALRGSEWPPLVPTREELKGDTAVFDLELEADRAATPSARAARARRVERGELVVRTVGAVELPYYRGVVPPTRRPGSPYPVYPAVLRERKIEGRVLLRAIIDAQGRYVLNSVWFPEVSGAMFAEAVRVALPTMRVEPARVAGCAVPMLVQQPFTFELR